MNTCFVAAAYKIPDERIKAWTAGNHDLMVQHGYEALIITDRIIEGLPEWCKHLIYPKPMQTFSITKCKNYGIRCVGEDVVVATDIDVEFSPEFMEAIHGIVDNEVLFPLYFAVTKFGERGCMHPWFKPCGTTAAMFSSWESVKGYNENMVAYGSDDGDLFNRFTFQGKFNIIRRLHPIWHVAHDGSTVTFDDRSDQWNRTLGTDPGFNPRNVDHNRNLLLTTNWCADPEAENWGKP